MRYAKYEATLGSNASITLVQGRARFIDASTVEVSQPGAAPQRLYADRVLIATGRSPSVPFTPGLSETPFWTSTTALLADSTPEHLVVYRASVFALELAQAFLRLGSKVTRVARSTLLSKEDPSIGAGLQSALEAEGMRILTHTQIQTVSHDGTNFHIDTGAEKISGDRFWGWTMQALPWMIQALSPSTNTCARRSHIFTQPGIAPTSRSTSMLLPRQEHAQHAT